MKLDARLEMWEDSLAPEAFQASLAATRAAARRRRVMRRAGRFSSLAIVLAGVAASLLRHTAPPESAAPRDATPVARPAFVAIGTSAEQGPVTEVPSSLPVVVVSTSAAGLEVVTSQQPPTPASEADLFAAAGARPAALQRHRDGTSRWIWLDQLR